MSHTHTANNHVVGMKNVGFPFCCILIDPSSLLHSSSGVDMEGGAVNFSLQGGSCSKHSESTVWIGYLGAVIAVVLFGSNFVPVKKFDTGDGESALTSSPSGVEMSLTA